MEIKEEFKDYMKEIVRSLPATLFFKDTEGKYVFTTKICDLINAGPDGTIIGKWDREIQYSSYCTYSKIKVKSSIRSW